MNPTIQLTPAELAEFQALAEHVDGFAAGARAMAEHLKQRHVEQILNRRSHGQNSQVPVDTPQE